MFFDSNFWGLAFLLAAISGGIGFVMNAFLDSEGDANKGKTTAILSAIITFVLARIMMYYYMPTFQGSFGGYWEVIAIAALPGLITGVIRGAKLLVPILAVLALLVVPAVQYVSVQVGPGNAKNWASQANIRTASADEKIPPTDPNKMVLVTKDIAVFKGQSALTGATGGSLSSQYKIDKDAYVLQAVQGHRYWIAPLIFVNFADDIHWNDSETPGYVVVDAQNPEKDAIVKLGYHLNLLDGGNFGLNLTRNLYQQGYNDGYFYDRKFEVDDTWAPHWVITYTKPAFNNIAGSVVDKIIVVNAGDGNNKVEEFTFKTQPKWIDRSMPESIVTEYLKNWGMYGGDFAKKNYWSVFWGANKTGSMKPADVELAYTTDEHSVYITPMTSTHEGDHATIGILVYETNDNEATYYPGLNGFNIGESVKQTMENVRDNIKHYPAGSVQLYSIYGELTWVAIYEAPQAIGKSFGGVGILHAHNQNASDVIFANDLQTALTKYAGQLANRGQNGGEISQTGQNSKQVSGKIKRIAYLPISQTSPTYVFVLEGDEYHTFTANTDSYAAIPLVQPGDEVKFTYLDTNGSMQAVGQFSCPAIDRKALAAPPVEKK